MLRSLAFVFVAGPAFALAWVALPHTGEANDLAIVLVCLGAWVCGGVLLLLPPRRATDLLFQVTLAIGTLLISVALYFSGTPSSGFGLFYLWTTPYAYFFFGARTAALHTVWVAVCSAAALVLQRELAGDVAGYTGGYAGVWLITIGTLAIVGILVRRLTDWMRESDARFRRGFDDSRLGMALIGTDLRYLEVNAALCEILGRPAEDIVGKHVNDVTHPDDLPLSPQVAKLAAQSEHKKHTFEKRMIRPDGSPVPVAINTSLVHSQSGKPLYFFTQVKDITERLRAHQELACRERQHKALARLGELALREADLGCVMTEVVATVAATLDVEVCDVLELDRERDELRLIAGVGWDDRNVPGTTIVASASSHAGYTLARDEPVVVEDLDTETRFLRSPVLSRHGVRSGIGVVIPGRERPFGVLGAHSTRKRPFSTDDVNFVQAVAGILSTAVERHRTEEANRHAALHDALTGLPNRTLLLDRIDQALRRRRREGTTVAVLMLDLDGFKVVNDSLGHAGGDRLLLTLAQQLQAAVRLGDTVARFGGDEFAVVCESLDDVEQVHAVAERLSRAISEPVVLQPGEHVVSASIGIAISAGPGDTAESLLRDADAAMYRAKEGGRGGHQLFDERLRQNTLQRLRTESGLRGAVERGEMRLAYQPVVSLSDGGVRAVEALLRWHHPDWGFVSPAELIPVAEQSGLIVPIGTWVLQEACRRGAELQRGNAGESLLVSANVSAIQLAQPDFADVVSGALADAGMAPESLSLELTETVFMQEGGAPVRTLDRLRELGVKVVLDDFGTGYSSLGYLERFPLDALKVDRAFAAGLADKPQSRAIYAAVVAMASALGLPVVAEGIETAEQVKELRALGCDLAQGFYFARPMPAEELEAFLRERHPGSRTAPGAARPAEYPQGV